MLLSDLQSLPIFPYADEFPYVSDEEILDLAQDIEANGLVHPIVLFGGQILDGRNRLRALGHTTVTDVPVETFEGTEVEAARHIKALNILRRHLNDAQRMILAMGMLPYEEREAKRRMSEGGGDKRSADRVVSTDTTQSDQSGKAAAQVADDFGLSAPTLYRGKQLFVAEDRDEDGVATRYVPKDPAAAAVVEMIKSGQITSVSGAVNEAEKRRAALAGRDESVENRKAGINPAVTSLGNFFDRSLLVLGDLDAALPALSDDTLLSVRRQVERIAARVAESLDAIAAAEAER